MWNRHKKRKINQKTGKREYRRKTTLQKLEKKADDLTKEIVRLRDGWKCQKCDKPITGTSEANKKSNAHRVHIVGCSHKLLRWDLINLLLLCMPCHRTFHDAEAIKEFVKKKWRPRWEYLYLPAWPISDVPRCNQTLPYRTLKEKEEWMRGIVADLEAKLKELKNG